jgi:hypothetical protein
MSASGVTSSAQDGFAPGTGSRPGRVRARDGAGQGRGPGGEGAGIADVREAQPVESAAEIPDGGEAVQ